MLLECCQLILLLFEISAPEQTSQGYTTAHAAIIKVSGLSRSNTRATVAFPRRHMRLSAQTHTRYQLNGKPQC